MPTTQVSQNSDKNQPLLRLPRTFITTSPVCALNKSTYQQEKRSDIISDIKRPY